MGRRRYNIWDKANGKRRSKRAYGGRKSRVAFMSNSSKASFYRKRRIKNEAKRNPLNKFDGRGNFINWKARGLPWGIEKWMIDNRKRGQVIPFNESIQYSRGSNKLSNSSKSSKKASKLFSGSKSLGFGGMKSWQDSSYWRGMNKKMYNQKKTNMDPTNPFNMKSSKRYRGTFPLESSRLKYSDEVMEDLDY